MAIQGLVEKVTEGGITGWCFDDERHEPVSLSLWCDDFHLATVRADRVRPPGRSVPRPDTGFVFRFKPKLLQVLPANAKLAVVADNAIRLPFANGAVPTLPFGKSDGLDALKEKLASGHVYSAKKGNLIFPLARRPDWQKQVIADYARASEIFLSAFDRPLWLAYGTLLGCIRDGDFIPHDDDFDTAFVSPATSVEGAARDFHEICDRLKSDGHVVGEMSGHFHWRLSKGCNIDVFMTWFDEDGYFGYNMGGAASPAAMHPKRHRFKDHDVWVPSRPETFLELAYGPGWKVPDPQFQWRRSQLVAMKMRELNSFSRVHG